MVHFGLVSTPPNKILVTDLEKAIKLEIYRRYNIKNPHAMWNILKWLFSLRTNRTKSISGKFDSTLCMEKWLFELKHPVMIAGVTVSLSSNKDCEQLKAQCASIYIHLPKCELLTDQAIELPMLFWKGIAVVVSSILVCDKQLFITHAKRDVEQARSDE